jgi:hypothetical protein
MIRSSSLVYGLLLAAWAAIVGWQPVEHARVKQSERAALVNRARDITTTLGCSGSISAPIGFARTP